MPFPITEFYIHMRAHAQVGVRHTLPLAPPEAIQVLLVYGLNGIVRGFVLDANLILAHSQCWFCQVSFTSLTGSE